MAIARDTTVNNGDSGGVNDPGPVNWSHTCTGSNLALFVVVATYISVVPPGGANNISGVTYGGAPMSLIGYVHAVGDTQFQLAIYGMDGPSAGTATISVSFTSSARLDMSFSASYTGVAQTLFPDNSTTFQRSSTFPTDGSYDLDLTPVLSNCWVLAASDGYYGLAALNSGGTSLGTDSHARVMDTNGPTSAADFNMTTTGGGGPDVGVLVSFAPAAAPGVPEGWYPNYPNLPDRGPEQPVGY